MDLLREEALNFEFQAMYRTRLRHDLEIVVAQQRLELVAAGLYGRTGFLIGDIAERDYDPPLGASKSRHRPLAALPYRHGRVKYRRCVLSKPRRVRSFYLQG